MKKWLIPYLIFACIAFFQTSVFAISKKKSHKTIISQTSYFKKASLLTWIDRHDKNVENFFYHQNIRASVAAVSYYIAEPYYLSSVSCYASWVMLTIKEAERVLKDHLLHLFPSHYFW